MGSSRLRGTITVEALRGGHAFMLSMEKAVEVRTSGKGRER